MRPRTHVNAARLQWLLERCNANVAWISDEEMDKFGERPEGPIMPSSHIVLESRRLSEVFGTDKNGKSVSTVNQVAASRTGEYYLVTSVQGQMIVFEPGATRHVRHLCPDDVDATMDDNPDVIIMGFTKNNEPVIFVDAWMKQTQTRFQNVWLGERLAHGSLSTKFLESVRVLYNGSVMWQVRPKESEESELLLNGKVIVFPKDKVWGISKSQEERDWISFIGSPARLGLLHIHTPLNMPMRKDREPYPVWLLDTRVGPVIIGKDNPGNHYACKMVVIQKDWSYQLEVMHSLGHGYLRGFTDIGNNEYAFIAQTARDNFEQWVMGKIEGNRRTHLYGPNFDHVSELFIQDNLLHYWAVAGRYLYKMRIHEVPEPQL